MADAVCNDRRSFLKSMGVGAGVVGAAGAIGAPVMLESAGASGSVPAAPAPAPVANFHIEIDGASGGYLTAMAGGNRVAEVVEEPGEGAKVRKHIGGVKYEDITAIVGPGTGPVLTDQIAAMLAGDRKPFGGAVSAVSTRFMEHSRLTFVNALITEVGFPALDGASKEPAFLRVTLHPESTQFRHQHEKIERPISAKQKSWLPCNFKLEIKGLDCRRVSKVDAFTIKQKVVDVGPDPVAAIEPGKLELPNITLYMADDAAALKFYDWFDSAVAAPDGDGDERDGTLTFYAQDLKTVLGTLSLTKLGPVRVAHDGTPSTGENIRRVKAELYCEEMSFKFSPSWA